MGRFFLADTPGLHKKELKRSESTGAGYGNLTAPLFRAEDDMVMDAIRLISSVTTAGHDTNNFTIKIINKGNDGSGTDVVAQAITDVASGGLKQFQPFSLTVDAAKAQLLEGDVLGVDVTELNAGMEFPRLVYEFDFKYEKPAAS